MNVDSVGRAAARERLACCGPDCPPDRALLIPAQRQIYNLMKFDSYPRFLKSDVYRDCIRTEMSGSAGAEAGVRHLVCTEETLSSLRRRKTDSLKTKRRKSMSFWENWSKGREGGSGGGAGGDNKDQEKKEPSGCTLTRVKLTCQLFSSLYYSVLLYWIL